MSSTRYLLGGLAVIGGVYYYDQNIRQIIPRSTIKHETERFDKFASQNASKLGNKVTHVVEDAKSELSHQKENLKQQWKDVPDADAIKKLVKDYSKDVRAAADDELGNKNPVIKGIDKYIDLVNKTAGEITTQYSSMGREAEVKGSWWDRLFHNTPDTVEDKLKNLDSKVRAEADRYANWGERKSGEVSRDAEKKKDGLLNWGSKKADEAQAKADEVAKDAENKKDGLLNWGAKKGDEAAAKAEDTKDSVLNWGSKKADEAQVKVDQAAKDAENKKDGLFNWGSKKADEAQAKADNVAKEAENKKDGLFNWGSKKADDAARAAEDAKAKGGDALNQASNEVEKQKKSWFSWGSKKADEAATATGRVAGDAQKTMEQIKEEATQKKDEVLSWTSQKLGELQNNFVGAKDHLAAKFEEEKAKATEAYNSARAHLDDLLSRYETSQEPTKDRELTKAKNDLKSAFDHLKLYGENTAEDLKRSFTGK